MIIVSFRILVVIATFFMANIAGAVSLDNFKVENKVDNESVITLFFSEKPKYHQFILKNPSRIVFDFSDLKVEKTIGDLPKNTNLIKRLRFARKQQSNVRLVLDVEEGTKLLTNSMTLKKGAQLTFTLVNQKLSVKQSTVKIEPLKEPLITDIQREVIVVIDPGHGGKDPGAVGGKKHQEKKIVLQIARKLKKMVDAQPGMKAYLTRNADYYVALRQRLALARKYNADIFISIHADAFLNRSSRGASVYSLSPRGATSEAARWLAASENHSELGGVDLSELDDDNGMIRSVLIDLSQTATISSSLSLGEKVLGGLNHIAQLHHDSVEQARFVVLKSPDIPSILVETGFISNRSEERLLASRTYQKKLATSIFNGINYYFKEHPPRNSKLASRPNVYLVKKGDTLSGIAKRFKVSMSLLKKANKLSNSHLHINQKLEVSF